MSVPARIAGLAAMIAGALLAGYSLYLGFSAKAPPAPLVVTLFLGGLVQVVLGGGLWQLRRTAWSFSLALYIVAMIAGLLAIPALRRGGVHVILATIPALFSFAMIVLIAVVDVTPKPAPPGSQRPKR